MSAICIPHCEACGAHHYPRRAVCPFCLSTEMGNAPVSGAGTLLARTVLHRSLSDAFSDQLPLAVGSVRLAEGPVVIAFLEGDPKPEGSVFVREEDSRFYARSP